MLSTFKCFTAIIFFVVCLPFVHSNVDNLLMVEYFLNKNVTNVIGFTCHDIKSNIEVTRRLSELKIKSTLFKLKNTDPQMIYLPKLLYSKIGIMVDLGCLNDYNITSIFSKATDYRMFEESCSWLIVGSTLNKSLALINDEAFGLSTDLLVTEAKNGNYSLYDVYNPCKSHGGFLNVTLLGWWVKDVGFNFNFHLKKSDRWNMHGMVLRLSGLVNNKPKELSLPQYLENYNMKEFDIRARIDYSLWIELANMFNFTVNYTEKSVWKPGDKNGPMMNAILKGESDGSGTAATVTADRMKIGKPVFALLPFRSCFFFRSVSSNKMHIQLIFEPLAPTVWYFIVIFSFLSINIMILLSIITNTEAKNSYVDSIMLFVGAFCQQGTDYKSTQASARIAILYIFLFNMLVNNYYMASVVSTRINSTFKKMNDSLYQLSKSDFTFAAEKTLYFNFYMKATDWETRTFYTKRWQKIPDTKKFMTPNDAMPLVLKGGFAYHTLPEAAYPFVERLFDERKICELTEVHLVKPTHLSYFAHINSSFTELFKVGFARISECGLRTRHINRWSTKKPHCRLDVLSIEEVTFYEIAPIVIFLLFSIVLACLIFMFEHLLFKITLKYKIK